MANFINDHFKYKIMLALGCFAHTLNLIVNDALNVDSLTSLINKIKIVVTHFRRSRQKPMRSSWNVNTIKVTTLL